jgi:predicted nucleotidyltransferase
MADRPSIDDLARGRGQILAVAARHGALNVRVFGSVARGDADAASDIDFLVDFEPGRSLLGLAALLVDLEDLLGHPVDVVTESGLKARMRGRSRILIR